ncbi:hypothetical protein [Orrella marina]|uniref:hypothetical protein n=1 Tax=Orrella marina TaxID=2163011 RepID=UPI00131F357C|nr:hypothetical protein [Orrella marina]
MDRIHTPDPRAEYGLPVPSFDQARQPGIHGVCEDFSDGESRHVLCLVVRHVLCQVAVPDLTEKAT